MEDIFVYDAGKKPVEIEGLDEIRAAKNALLTAGVRYHEAKTRFERGEIEFEDVPIPDHSKVAALLAKYPRAAAYLEAERWSYSTDPEKANLGSLAMGKILRGDDPEAVIQGMSKALDVYYQAQMEG